MHDLLQPAADVPAAHERCRRYLGTRWRRFRFAYPLLPKEIRDDLVVAGAWHQLVRDADRETDEHGRRTGLAELEAELEALATHRAGSALGLVLHETLERHGIPPFFLRGPIEARKRRIGFGTFATRAELEQHAERVAAPEARLLLRAAGAETERNLVLADACAVGVQLTAWIGALHADLPRGLVHVPAEECARFGVGLDELGRLRDGRARALFAQQIRRARAYLAKGWPVCRALGMLPGRELAFFLRWHAAALAALEARDFDAVSGPLPSGWARALACAGASIVRIDAPELLAG